MTVEIANNVLKINELADEGIQFVSFELEESILGPLPKAKLVIRCKKDQIEDLTETIVTIIDDKGNQQEGSMYVYDLNYYDNQCTIKFLGCPTSFTRDTCVTKYSNIKNAVQSIYPGEVLSNVESDILDDVEIYQTNESNYKLCNKLLSSWRKDTIFGYCLDGLRLMDLSNYQPLDVDIFSSGGSLKVTDPASLSRPKLYEKQLEFIDYSNGADPNHIYAKFDKMLVPINTEYKDLVSNLIYNKKFDSMATTVNYQTRFLAPVYLCDGLLIKGNEGDSVSTFSTEEMFIGSKTIRFYDQKVEMDLALRSVNP
jgi:hypothetical protein